MNEMPDIAESSRQSRILRMALAAAVMAVTLLNGSEYFLKRIGLIDRPAYERYFELHREGEPYPRGLVPTEQNARERPFREAMMRTEGLGVALKISKDLFVVALLVTATMCLVRSGGRFPRLEAWPAYALALAVASAFAITAMRYGLLLPVAGLRAFAFLPLALLLASCVSLRRTLADALATAAGALLGIEAVAVMIEAVWGMPIYGYLFVGPDIPGRLAGTFVVPSTLGVFAVLAYTFRLSSAPDRPRVLLVLLTLVLIIASSSGTGVVVLAAVAAAALLRRLGRRWLLPVSVAFVAAVVLAPVACGTAGNILVRAGQTRRDEGSVRAASRFGAAPWEGVRSWHDRGVSPAPWNRPLGPDRSGASCRLDAGHATDGNRNYRPADVLRVAPLGHGQGCPVPGLLARRCSHESHDEIARDLPGLAVPGICNC